LEREVKRLEGVDKVQGNYMMKTLKVTYDPNRVQLDEIEDAIERIGYRIAYKKYPGVLSKLKGLVKREKADVITPLTDVEFPGKVLHASRPVAILFSSPTCPACHFFRGRFREIVENTEDRVDFYEMDIAATETWRTYDILSVPTVLIFRNGALSQRFDAMPREDEVASALGA
jgi:copper chaperone CopZ/thiol-disulfide isomerase/thioredoxin